MRKKSSLNSNNVPSGQFICNKKKLCNVYFHSLEFIDIKKSISAVQYKACNFNTIQHYSSL
jgi:hypothetical protein